MTSLKVFLFCTLAIFHVPLHVFAQGNFWQQTNGPYGGRVNKLVIDSSHNIFASTENGIFRSVDSGNNWSPVNIFSQDTSIGALAASSGSILLAGTRSGVLRSTDGGLNWYLSNSGLPDTNVTALASDSLGTLFLGLSPSYGVGQARLFNSTDNGSTWFQISPDWLNNTYVRSILVTNTGSIFVGTSPRGIFRTTDGGINWTQVNSGLVDTSVYAIAVNHNGDLFVGTASFSTSTGGSVFRSTDNGTTWVQVNSGLGNPDVLSLTVNSSGDIFAGTLLLGMYRSTNNGTSWTPINVGLTDSSVIDLTMGSGNKIFAATFDGVFSSADNGENWLQGNAGLLNTDVYCLRQSSTGTLLAGTFRGGVFRSTDQGANWTQSNNGLTTIRSKIVNAFAVKQNGMVFAGTRGRIFRSEDDGATWITPANNGLTSTWINKLAVNTTGEVFAATQDSGIYRSTNDGQSWTKIYGDSQRIAVYSLAINRQGHIFAGTYRSFDERFIRSTDNGLTWTTLQPAPLFYSTIDAIAFDSTNRIYAGTSGIADVYISTDNGNSWRESRLSSSTLYGSVFDIAVDYNGHAYVTTYGSGVFRSTDQGFTWVPLNSGLTVSSLYSIATNATGYIFVGGAGKGVFRSSQPTTSVDENMAGIPTGIVLYQNYPNPFNPSTKISYSVSKAGFVSLVIYDVLGREVSRLIQENKPAGEYSVTWNASDVPSGVYFYRLTAGAYTETKKMLLMR